MRFTSVAMLCMTSLIACSDSDRYPMPPEYGYGSPQPADDEHTPSSTNVLSIALAMGEKSTATPSLPEQKNVAPEPIKEPSQPVKPQREKMPSPAPAPKKVATAVTIENKPATKQPNTGFKELDFSSRTLTEKKITTVKLDNEESTQRRAQKKLLYRSTERGRFYKTDQRGRVINAESERWFCVKDNTHNVLWEAKTTGKQRHTQHTYTVEGDAGQCNQKQCSTQQYIQYLNKIALCGRSNWRLPKKTELNSLTKSRHEEGEAAIDSHYFPNTQLGYYWSSTPFQYAKNRTWTVDFSSGFEKSQAKTQPFHLRLISSY
ncbi:MAG: DUF1566 domain-containing protein [Gammaproteobacteria bacterium]|nr:DUF1566 domain-containing protein [Gammaproteobacteria bacterium]MCF6231348.1 DUF1566 domain-containing protein [Gammaproteobacteria bacterium]